MRRALCALFVLLAACSSGGAKPSVPVNGVLVADFEFRPSTVTVHVGDTVTWVFDQPDAPHNVFATSGPEQFDSGAPVGKGTYRHTFTKAGTYRYECQVHPNMTGTIVVSPS
jgi:plastocyanin